MSRGDPRPPPADLATRSLASHIKTVSSTFWRLSHAAAPLVDWSNNRYARFSRPDLPCRVLYLASGKGTALWERFGDELTDQAAATRALSRKLLAERVWKEVTMLKRLKVLDLTLPSTLRAIGADGATFLAHYGVTQAWAAVLMAHPAGLDGVIYVSRLNPRNKCLALFERARPSDPLRVRIKAPAPIDDPVVLAILGRQKVRLVD